MEIHASILQTILEVFSMQMQNPLGENGHYLYSGLFCHGCVVSIATTIIPSDKTTLELSLDFNNTACFFIFYDTSFIRELRHAGAKSLLCNRRIRSCSWICLNRKFNYFLPFKRLVVF